ncbi:MAG: adenylate/guanylate cyclase domain-containing protein [Fibrobacterales bacterium]
MAFVGLTMVLGFHYQDIITDLPNKYELLRTRVFAATVLAIVGVLIYRSKSAARTNTYIMSAFYITTFFIGYWTNQSGGIHNSYWYGINFILLFWLMFMQFPYKKIVFHGALYIVLFWIIIYSIEVSPVTTERFIEINLLFLGTLSIGATKSIVTNLDSIELFEKQSTLTHEVQRTERLLLNILPDAIAQKLKLKSHKIVETHDLITVLFSDVVGFTRFSQEQPPELVVAVLNSIFSGFDTLCEKYSLEKIKTIGDSYMVVGGAPQYTASHTERTLFLAQEMLDVVAQVNIDYQLSLQIRIGVHTGPAIAGVIGKRKFSYDIWGATVNVANKLEKYSSPNQILVSKAVTKQCSIGFTYNEAHSIELDSEDSIETYFLEVG